MRIEKGDIVILVNKMDKFGSEINDLRAENMQLKYDIGRSLAAIEEQLIGLSAPVQRPSVVTRE